MKLKQRLTLTLMTLFLTLFISACSSDSKALIENKNLNAVSNEKVTIKASNAEAYNWSQISGTEVILINAKTSTLSFIAPEVQTEETLVFELEALIASLAGEDIIKKERATVTVSPLEISTENNETNTTIDTNTTNQTSISLKSIKLTIEKTSLNLDENTTLNAIATYSDTTTKDITQEVEWIISDLNAVEITKHNLITKKEINITLQAKLNAVTSNAVALEIYQEINGHRLPPQPDKTLNDSTLLGIDSNGNGVRDDVERWIYETYKDKHPIYIDIAMQAGRAYKQVLETPERALEIRETVVNAPYICASHYKDYAKFLNEPVLVHERIDSSVYSKYFNTKERIDVYWQYDTLLSGGSYPLPKIRKMKSFCDFNTSKYDKK